MVGYDSVLSQNKIMYLATFVSLGHFKSINWSTTCWTAPKFLGRRKVVHFLLQISVFSKLFWSTLTKLLGGKITTYLRITLSRLILATNLRLLFIFWKPPVCQIVEKPSNTDMFREKEPWIGVFFAKEVVLQCPSYCFDCESIWLFWNIRSLCSASRKYSS